MDLAAVVGDEAGDCGVPDGALLAEFAETVLGEDDGRLADTRWKFRVALGDAALVDTAAVIANYAALDRVADATGIPLEAAKESNTAAFRAELGIDALRRGKG